MTRCPSRLDEPIHVEVHASAWHPARDHLPAAHGSPEAPGRDRTIDDARHRWARGLRRHQADSEANEGVERRIAARLPLCLHNRSLIFGLVLGVQGGFLARVGEQTVQAE